MRHLVCLLVLSVAVAPRALARDHDRSCVVLPALAEAGTPEAFTTELMHDLHAALQARGWASQSTRGAIPVEDPRCATDVCLEQVLQAGAPGLALRLRIFHLPQGHSVTVLAFRASEEVYAVDVEGTGSRVDALGAALDALQTQLERGPGPWLVLSAKPPDATARLDGRVLGILPLTVRVTPGEHVLEILHPGYATYNTTLTIGELAGSMHEVTDVALKPLASAFSDALASFRARRRTTHRLMGTGLSLAATGALGGRLVCARGRGRESAMQAATARGQATTNRVSPRLAMSRSPRLGPRRSSPASR